MPRSSPRPPVLLFGVVALYVVLQFVWWAWLLVSRGRELQALQTQLLAAGLIPQVAVEDPEDTLRMVAGEGGVLLALLLLALWLTYRTVRHEITLARQQRDFLLAASHELRTPIAGLKLHLQTLRREDVDAAQRDALAGLVRIEVDRLHALTEKILLATRLDDAGAPLRRHRIDASALLDAIRYNAGNTFGRGHQLRFTVPEGSALATDPDAFRSVIDNLVENACKYSPAGSVVEVELIRTDGRTEVHVRDEGAGIPEEERGAIFHKFHRGGSEETRATRGTGLGLFIVDRLMAALGGHVEHRPRAPRGSIFVAAFPNT